MDNRLFQLTSSRPYELRRVDLPELTKALVALFRGRAQAKFGSSQNLKYTHISGLNVDIQILASDWIKLEPFFRDDTFSSLMSRRPANAVPLHPSIAATVPENELIYHTSVYNLLYPIFT